MEAQPHSARVLRELRSMKLASKAGMAQGDLPGKNAENRFTNRAMADKVKGSLTN